MNARPRFVSALHDERTAAILGIALGASLVVSFLTGLESHLVQQPPSWFEWPSRPAGLYRVTQGLHVVTVKPGTPFGFKFVACWLSQVANPDAPPPKWRITQTKVPFTEVAAKGALIFGGAVLKEGGFVYIFGGDSRPEAKQAGVPNGMPRMYFLIS